MRRRRMLRELDRDLREHIEAETRANIERGMSPDEARYAALRKFGNVTRVREETREVWSLMWLDRLVQDVRFSVRILRKSPAFAAVAVVTLALAIGANAVVFGVLNALILRPLDVPHAGSLYTIESWRMPLAPSYPDYLDLRDRNRSFESLAAYNSTQAGLDAGGNPVRAFVDEVSGNYFEAFGIQPYLGRLIQPSDERGPNSAPYMVLNYAYWQSHFQGDRAVIGRTVQLNKRPFTIIGVAPAGFHGPVLFFTQDVFVPMVNQEQVEGQSTLNARGRPSLFMTIGHLKAGVTRKQAVEDLNSVGSYLEKTYPKTDSKMTFALGRPMLFGDFGAAPTRAFLAALMLLAGLILLAACANLGSLFAARAGDRAQEMALRLALGASRRRVLRALFTEALLIALIGGTVGLCGGAALLRGLSAWQPVPKIPFHVAVYPDANVYAVAVLLTLISGLLFGAVPVRQVLRTDPYQIVKSGARTTGSWRITVRDVLLAVQIAICAVLITSSMVAVRGLLRSLTSDFGFEPQNAVLMETDLAMGGYRGDAISAMQKRMMDGMQTVPGVVSVGFADRTPLNGTMRWSKIFAAAATDLRPANAAAEAPTYSVSPAYFRTAHTTMLAGRDFTWHDDEKAPRVAVINQQFARMVFGSAKDVLGMRFKLQDGTSMEVVGMVEEGKYQRIGEDTEPAMFVPILQSPSTATTMVVRTDLDPQQVMAAMKNKLRELDPGLPSFTQTWNKELGLALFVPRMATISLGVLGVMGGMLSITGIFGIAAYSVSRRMKELGIRLALGAKRKEVLQAALGRAFQLLVFGSAAGLVMGIVASQVLASIVYQASPRDPLVLAGVVAIMAMVGLVGTAIPARRVLSLEPLALLREE